MQTLYLLQRGTRMGSLLHNLSLKLPNLTGQV